LCAAVGREEGVELQVHHMKPTDQVAKLLLGTAKLCAQHNYLKKNFTQTESGKRFLYGYMNRQRRLMTNKCKIFAAKILAVYEKNKVNAHIVWER
jgi:hypothetical protein